MPRNVSISAKAKNYDKEINPSHNVNFRVPYGDVNIGGGAKLNAGFELKVEKDDRAYYICVHSTGLIEELGFLKDIGEDDLACDFGI